MLNLMLGIVFHSSMTPQQNKGKIKIFGTIVSTKRKDNISNVFQCRVYILILVIKVISSHISKYTCFLDRYICSIYIVNYRRKQLTSFREMLAPCCVHWRLLLSINNLTGNYVAFQFYLYAVNTNKANCIDDRLHPTMFCFSFRRTFQNIKTCLLFN